MQDTKIRDAAGVLAALRGRGLDIRFLGGDRNRPVIHRPAAIGEDAITEGLKLSLAAFREEIIEIVMQEQQP